MPVVRTGLDLLRADQFASLRGLTVGLVTHAAAVDSQLVSALELFAHAPNLRLAACFGPEHGLTAEAQDLIQVEDKVDPQTQLRVHSLYGDRVESLRPCAEMLTGLDALVIDLQDIGTRYYTFQATMLYVLEEASRHKLLTVVLDRPNPLGGVAIEGPALRSGFESFVGPHNIATRHGLTLGELARLYHTERGLTGELRVIACEGWHRTMTFDQTGLPWVLPSPNMPTLETAFVYPGQCLIEGTNLSEGRGTTRPFELSGAPWVHPDRLCAHLRAEALPGVVFRPTRFRPTFHKFAGQSCGGVQIHVTDRNAFLPVRTGLAVLAALRAEDPTKFAWRTEPYEFVADRPAIDLLFGSDRERLGLESGTSTATLMSSWNEEERAFRQRRNGALIYTTQRDEG